MSWIFDFLSRFADFVNYCIWLVRDALRDLAVFVTQILRDVWNNHIVGWFYQYTLADLLPDPGLGRLAEFINAASPYTYTVYALVDYVCYARIVWSLIVLYLQVGLVVTVYRTWMAFKRATPLIG